MQKENPLDVVEYVYMDDMDLEGWMWEFIRRSSDYQDKYTEIINTLYEDYPYNVLRKHMPALNKMGIASISWNFNRDEYDDLRSDCFLYAEVASSSPDFRCFEGIPNPSKRYIDLKESNEFKNAAQDLHFITGIRPFKTGFLSNINDGSQYERLIERLAMPVPEETLYVGIARTIKIGNLGTYLLPRLKKILEERSGRMRMSKWKNYLISYDLRARGLTYSQISTYMTRACSEEDDERLCDERNIENYHAQAVTLINGGYKKLLYLGD